MATLNDLGYYDPRTLSWVGDRETDMYSSSASAREMQARALDSQMRVDRAIAEQFRMMSDDGLWPRPFDAPQPKRKENSPPTTPPTAVSTFNPSKVLLLCSN